MSLSFSSPLPALSAHSVFSLSYFVYFRRRQFESFSFVRFSLHSHFTHFPPITSFFLFRHYFFLPSFLLFSSSYPFCSLPRPTLHHLLISLHFHLFPSIIPYLFLPSPPFSCPPFAAPSFPWGSWVAGFVAGHGWVMALVTVSSLQLNEITFLCLFTPGGV